MSMRKMWINIILLGCFWFLLASTTFGQSLAQNIVLDGNFSDWTDKPYVTDPMGDEAATVDITEVRWFPDNVAGNLYFYIANGQKTSSASGTWVVTTYVLSEDQWFTVQTYVSRSKGTVTVYLYDPSGELLWSQKGQWSKLYGKRFEFYVPLNKLMSSVTGGYELDMKIYSNQDAVPDWDYITISSVDTFSKGNLAMMGLIILSSGYWGWRKQCFR